MSEDGGLEKLGGMFGKACRLFVKPCHLRRSFDDLHFKFSDTWRIVLCYINSVDAPWLLVELSDRCFPPV
ncbi:MAG: hypothetical protein J7L99_00470 [Planctomycetes bacterium]|nr:hypothetical protein [Planctomycetota bacterium]